MTSFLKNCAQCGVMGPKDGRCPECGYSDSAVEDTAASMDVAQEFAARYAVHSRNKGVAMMMTLALGFVGLITAFLWVLVIYRGSLIAFLLVGAFSVMTGVLTAVRFFSDRWFPTQLLCPSCDSHLEALNHIGEECPACHSILRIGMPIGSETAEPETAMMG